MLKNRTASLTIIFLVYIFAAFCGILSYYILAQTSTFSWQISLLLADIFTTAVVFVFSLIFNNASVYDPYWSVQPPVILFVALLKNFNSNSGNTFLGWLLFSVVLFWALRLTANWAYNFKSFEYQDWRYVMLKEKSGRAYPLINFLGIHLFPTFVVYLCILPAVTVIHTGAGFNLLCSVFLLFSLAAAFFQGIADIQMHKFRALGTGGFIRTGLWKHSRHPNYACEILMWWGVGLASVCAMPERWYLLAGAFINTLMFLFISIPMADKRQSRKPGFAEYKKATRML
ncbi:MAG: DUF1295 domain-containing protein [Treponema sp.]|nr:DUF1295 domain-containing protein [Treponema sp.]